MSHTVKVVEVIEPLSELFDKGCKFVETFPNSNVFRPEEHQEGYVGLDHRTFGSRFERYFKELEPAAWEDHPNYVKLETDKQDRIAVINTEINELEIERRALLEQ